MTIYWNGDDKNMPMDGDMTMVLYAKYFYLDLDRSGIYIVESSVCRAKRLMNYSNKESFLLLYLLFQHSQLYLLPQPYHDKILYSIRVYRFLPSFIKDHLLQQNHRTFFFSTCTRFL